MCVLLRVVEGVGTAVVSTAIFATFPNLFPDAVGTLVVHYHISIFLLQVFMHDDARVYLNWELDLGMQWDPV